jgi:hypothetical protein
VTRDNAWRPYFLAPQSRRGRRDSETFILSHSLRLSIDHVEHLAWREEQPLLFFTGKYGQLSDTTQPDADTAFWFLW